MGVIVESKSIPAQLFWLRNSDLYQYQSDIDDSHHQFEIDELKFYSNLEAIQSADESNDHGR